MPIPARERGAALLAVLVLVAIMGALAAAAFEKLRLSTALAANHAALDQARAYAVGVESLLTLRVDDLIAASPERTTLEGDWNGTVRRIPLPGGVGVAGAAVRDGGNCFNINSVVQGAAATGLTPREFGIGQFAGLLHLLGVPDNEARRIAESAADWADSDMVPSGAGAEDSAYVSGERPYRTGNTLFAETSELRAVAGMTPEIYERARPWLCALPTSDLSPLNVNTLLPDQSILIAMLAPYLISPQIAREALAARPASGWESLSDFWSHPALARLVLPFDAQTQPQLRTRWFALDMKVEVRGSELIETALVDARIAPSRLVVRRWGSAD